MGPKAKIRRKFPNFILQNLEKQIAPCEHTTREDLVHRLKSKSHLKKNLIIDSGSKKIDESSTTSILPLLQWHFMPSFYCTCVFSFFLSFFCFLVS